MPNLLGFVSEKLFFFLPVTLAMPATRTAGQPEFTGPKKGQLHRRR